LFPASLPSGLPQNPNVLLIRTHPNPSPSVANSHRHNIGNLRICIAFMKICKFQLQKFKMQLNTSDGFTRLKMP
jgi:hypothetical protein